jgi:hypothetical protein
LIRARLLSFFDQHAKVDALVRPVLREPPAPMFGVRRRCSVRPSRQACTRPDVTGRRSTPRHVHATRPRYTARGRGRFGAACSRRLRSKATHWRRRRRSSKRLRPFGPRATASSTAPTRCCASSLHQARCEEPNAGGGRSPTAVRSRRACSRSTPEEIGARAAAPGPLL